MVVASQFLKGCALGLAWEEGRGSQQRQNDIYVSEKRVSNKLLSKGLNQTNIYFFELRSLFKVAQSSNTGDTGGRTS